MAAMFKFLEYLGKAQALRGRLIALPVWARVILFVMALPGAVLLGLSIAAALFSLCLLSLLTVPTYRFLRALTGRGETVESPADGQGFASSVSEAFSPSPGRRHVEVKIIDQP